MLQTGVVGLLVAGCFVYAAWQLMPHALRRPLARQLLSHAAWLPRALRRPLERASQAASMGCDTCDRCEPGQADNGSRAAKLEQNAKEHPLVFHPRKKL